MKTEKIGQLEIGHALYERAELLATKDGFADTDAWLLKQAQILLERQLAGDTDLKPKDAAAQLKIGKVPLLALCRDGHFPHAYYVNSRVLRIPQADVDAYKAKRQRAVA